MGKRGPQPAPTPLKLVRGDRKSRVNRAAPIPDLEEVVPPASLNDAALAVWAEYAPRLERRDVLTAWDLETFGWWCDLTARAATAAGHLDVEGEVIEVDVFDRSGQPTGSKRRQRNEWWTIRKDAIDQAARLGARFGLSPSERAQLKVGADDPARGKSKERLLS